MHLNLIPFKLAGQHIGQRDALSCRRGASPGCQCCAAHGPTPATRSTEMWVMYPDGRVIHQGEADFRSEVGMSEFLKKFGCSSLGNARRAIDDEVLLEGP